jgi:hypothetical protein
MNLNMNVVTLLKKILTMEQENGAPEKKCNIFIACMPKSGSTYLSTLLTEATGFEKVPAIQIHNGVYYWYNEQDIYEGQLEKIAAIDSVTQQHTKGTENNVTLMLKYNIRPVVLVRNIYDMLMSHYDHIENDDHRQPVGFVHKEYFKMSYNEKIQFLIDMHLPWYFNFLISWHEASQRVSALWMTYDEVVFDQVASVQKVLGFYDLHKETTAIEAAITSAQEKNTRFNKGLAGRGASLDQHYKADITNKANVWKIAPHIFELIGIEDCR